MRLSKNFVDKEFACKCCGQSNMHFTFILYLQAMRDHFGKPIVVTSGFRCKKHNEKIGGSPNSMHMKGMAADIRVHNSNERFELVDAAIKAGFKRIGIYMNAHIHVDTKPEKPIIWTGQAV